jgi:hypothetical protein
LRSQQSNAIGKAISKTDSFSSSSAGSPRSGINGGLPAVVKKVGCLLVRPEGTEYCEITDFDWVRKTEGELDIKVGFISSFRQALIIQTT